MRYLSFRTELFFSDIPDNQIGKWFIGGDCAGWIYARLLPLDGVTRNIEPVMEDWGWFMSVNIFEILVTFSIWENLDHSDGWIIGIDLSKKSFRRLSADRKEEVSGLAEKYLAAIVDVSSHFTDLCWSDVHPNEA